MNTATSLLIERDQDLVTITMNRPPANALNAQLIVELLEAIRRLADDENPPGIVLTGSGDRFFSAGGDIKEVVGIDVARPRIRFFHELLVAMENWWFGSDDGLGRSRESGGCVGFPGWPGKPAVDGHCNP